ncbi:hypothetical protein GJ744_002837 [Endocarpon pusillum]|uniref:Uncharacterized protein n=1 Tax=Endocarpon pusillum TaxID=364733 RepID=A0A8H7DZR4_9EURO|nr:hypothetical protein GJ744_002837 [Endocarpon pusillum]
MDPRPPNDSFIARNGIAVKIYLIKNARLYEKNPSLDNLERLYCGWDLPLYKRQHRSKRNILTKLFKSAEHSTTSNHPSDPRNIADEFMQFSRFRYATAAMTAWNEWKGARGDDHVDGPYNTNTLAAPIKTQQTDPTFRPRGRGLPDLNPEDFVVPEEP